MGAVLYSIKSVLSCIKYRYKIYVDGAMARVTAVYLLHW